MRLATLTVLFCLFTHASQSQADEQLYVKQIKPLLARHCGRCHGPKKQESELRLDTGAKIIAGGNHGNAVVPGRPNASLLIQVVTDQAKDIGRMPPEGEGKLLTAKQIALLRRWIESGAKFPANETSTKQRRSSDHWSFQPIVRHTTPSVKNRSWVRNPIDAFILSKLEATKLSASPQAQRATLIRRLSLDLLGLPPSIAEVTAFVKDRRPGAYDHLVQRLLSSPRFGERWGRHWLDQARYADSDGYTNDNARKMWRYRDWVIDALNRDLTFDQFTVEQFAGDLLPKPTVDQIVATGFHRNTQRNREGGSNFEQYRTEAVIDRVATTGVVFLGLTLGCARCHDHKYDPISQREFYQIFAFLNNQEEPKITVPFREASPELIALKSKRDALARQIKQGKIPKKTGQTRLKRLTDRLNKMIQARHTTTLVMRELKKPRRTTILIRGDFLRKGKQVQADVPDVLPPLAKKANASRLDLAHWLVSARNPLTPRVTVNRIWQQLFGVGIVETENDFGLQGSKPSHPKLLDWLASEFVRQQWSMKAFLRTIVTSSTYRQASIYRLDLARVDPRNRLLGRQNRLRLEGEVIRDTSLAASGLLTNRMKGPGVFPPQPAGVMKLTRNPNRKWRVSSGENRFRRGLYTFFWRSTPYPFLKLFNSPESNTTCTRRDRSNTPLQALTLLNDEVFVEAAQALAAHSLRSSASGDRQRLIFAFRSCLARPPSKLEIQALEELLTHELAQANDKSLPKLHPAVQVLPNGVKRSTFAAWTSIARAILNLDEFITRE